MCNVYIIYIMYIYKLFKWKGRLYPSQMLYLLSKLPSFFKSQTSLTVLNITEEPMDLLCEIYLLLYTQY